MTKLGEYDDYHAPLWRLRPVSAVELLGEIA